eukprot:1150964-Pelagomonas_calceolata.AAC.1
MCLVTYLCVTESSGLLYVYSSFENLIVYVRLLLNASMMAHWAVESASPGFVSVAFAEQPGKMVPAEAVLGGVDDASGG